MAILAYKSGTIISVRPTGTKGEYKENAMNGAIFKISKREKHRKVFTGDNAVNEALKWVGTPEALELVQEYEP
jgi:hypothetical protein